MLLLHVLLLLLLLALRRFVGWRVRRLERAYVRVTGAAEQALQQATTRPGNASRPDPYQLARRQYELGRLATARDAVENRYVRWQRNLEWLGGLVTRLRGWRGRLFPYFVGAFDLTVAFVVLELFEVGDAVGPHALTQQLLSLLGGQ